MWTKLPHSWNNFERAEEIAMKTIYLLLPYKYYNRMKKSR